MQYPDKRRTGFFLQQFKQVGFTDAGCPACFLQAQWFGIMMVDDVQRAVDQLGMMTAEISRLQGMRRRGMAQLPEQVDYELG